MSTSRSMHRPQRVVAVVSALLFVLAALPTILAASAEPASASTLTSAWSEYSANSAPTVTDLNGTTYGFENGSIAYDPRIGRTIFFGGMNPNVWCPVFKSCLVTSAETWSWNYSGSGWSGLSPAASPEARYSASMAYDPATDQMILFGGTNSTFQFNDTWNWTGTTWTQLLPATSPSLRSGAAMAFDPSTGQLLLFGGAGSTNFVSGPPTVPLNDTWTWNGTTWTQLSPATSPTPRSGASMAFDPSTGQMIMYGGINEFGTPLNETWTWNGTTWSYVPGGTSGGRSQASMAFDPSTSQMVLFGGTNVYGNPLNDTWTWNGSVWTQMRLSTSPPARTGAAMAYDQTSGLMVITGGNGGSGSPTFLTDTWYLAVASPKSYLWAEGSPAVAPAARTEAAITFDDTNGTTVLFGGRSANGTALADTWIGSGTNWTQVFPAHSPPARSQASMAYDPTTGNVVLFGGIGAGGFARGDLWVWNGTDWTELFPFSGSGNPMPRWGANLAFDPGSGQLLLFGGDDNGIYYNDTWGWNGTIWTHFNPVTAPPTRSGAAMAYYPSSGSMMLFGGTAANGAALADTWTWNGTTWSQVSPATSPPARTGAAATFDVATSMFMLVGGNNGSTYFGDMWTWNGSTWSNFALGNTTTARTSPAMVYDNAAGVVVLFGGSNATTTFGDTRIFSVVQAPTVTAVTPGTGSIGGGTRVTIWGTGFALGDDWAARVAPTGYAPASLAGLSRDWFIPLDVSVAIGGVPCTAVDVISSTELTCTTGPNSAGTSDVVVTVAGLSSTSGTGLFTHVDYVAPKFTG